MTELEKLNKREADLLRWHDKLLISKSDLTPAQFQKKRESYMLAREKFENAKKEFATRKIVVSAPARHTGYALIYKKWLSDEWKEATTGEITVLVVLVAYGAKSGKCFLGMRGIAALTHASLPTVRKHISGLQKKGIIEITKKGGANNIYRIVK